MSGLQISLACAANASFAAAVLIGWLSNRSGRNYFPLAWGVLSAGWLFFAAYLVAIA